MTTQSRGHSSRICTLDYFLPGMLKAQAGSVKIRDNSSQVMHCRCTAGLEQMLHKYADCCRFAQWIKPQKDRKMSRSCNVIECTLYYNVTSQIFKILIILKIFIFIYHHLLILSYISIFYGQIQSVRDLEGWDYFSFAILSPLPSTEFVSL